MKNGLNYEALSKIASLRDEAKVAQEESGYQGWANYETWAVALWLDNDEGSYNYWRERAQEIREEGDFGGRGENEFMRETPEDEKVMLTIADELKDQHEEYVAGVGLEGFAADLLNAALSEVNWREIAENMMRE